MKALLTMLFLAAPISAGTIFTLNPLDGQTSGPAGGTVGFGFNLFNDNGFLVADQVVFLPDGAALPFTDFLTPKFNVIGGGIQTWTQDFDASLQTGVGSFNIPGTANPGDLFGGELRLYYDLFSVDPSDPDFDPGTDQISSGTFIPIEVQIEVSAQQTPEPAPVYLVATVLLLWLVRAHGAASQRKTVNFLSRLLRPS